MTPLFRLASALAMLGLSAGAQAQDVVQDKAQSMARGHTQNVSRELRDPDSGVRVGIGVICNSRDQMTRYLAAKNAARKGITIEAAIETVNREVKDTRACGMAMVAFVTGDRTDDVDVPNGMMHVTRITVTAVATDLGWQNIPGTVQYTAFFEKMEEI